MHTPNSSLLKRLPVYHWSDLPQLASLALLYALLANVSLTYFLGNSVVAIVWLPSGLALAALLMGGRQILAGCIDRRLDRQHRDGKIGLGFHFLGFSKYP